MFDAYRRVLSISGASAFTLAGLLLRLPSAVYPAHGRQHLPGLTVGIVATMAAIGVTLVSTDLAATSGSPRPRG